MALPPKKILIRLAIYVPLLGIFGWQALDRFLEDREPTSTVDETQLKLEALPPEKFKEFTLPDGTIKRVPILTPDEAREIYGIEVPQSDESAEADPEDNPEPDPNAKAGPGIRASGPPKE
jgi:hypothetical protein